MAEISTSSVYYLRKVERVKPPGRSPPGFTVNRDGAIITDQTIVRVLKEYRSSIEFANGGSIGNRSPKMFIDGLKSGEIMPRVVAV